MKINRKKKLLLGVCSGLADHFGIDTIYIRLAFIVMVLYLGFGVIPYLLLFLVMERDNGESDGLDV